MAVITQNWSVVLTVPWQSNGAPIEQLVAIQFDDAVPAEYPTFAQVEAEAKRLVAFNGDASATWNEAQLPAALETGDMDVLFIQEIATAASPYVATNYTWAP